MLQSTLYLAYELIIQSFLELPGFSRVTEQQPDIVVCGQFVDCSMVNCTNKVEEQKTDNGIDFHCPFGVMYRVTNGEKISLISLPRKYSKLETLPLYGFALATVLHQRGIFVLHGSAVAIGTKGVVVVGEKMAGKSSLVMALLASENQLISDDVTGVVFDRVTAEVLPGFASVKLWPDVLQVLGIDPTCYPALHAETEKKHYFPEKKSCCGTRVKLEFIVVLIQSDMIRTEELIGREKVLSILKGHYMSRYEDVFSVDEEKNVFLECVRIAQQVRVIKLYRPKNLLLLQDAAMELVEVVSGGKSIISQPDCGQSA